MRKYELETVYEPDASAPAGFRIRGLRVYRAGSQQETVCRGSTPDEVMLRLEALGIPWEEVFRPDPERRAG